MVPNKIIAIGASVGGVDALRVIVAGLPDSIEAALFVTLHIGAHHSILPGLLQDVGPLSASHAVHHELIRSGHIFVAPPDRHMTIEHGRIALTKGPRENLARPSIDPMLRSAARTYGSDVIGVILTGGLNDGTAGLYEVKAQGGTAIVQDPSTAAGTGMPQSAIKHVDVDHIVAVADIAPLLIRLVGAEGSRDRIAHGDQSSGDSQEKGMTAQFTLNHPVAVTCPDCGGALRRSELGSLTQFSCHIGHVYTAEVMMAAQFIAMERSIESAMRSLCERADLCRSMIAQNRVADDASRDQWEEAMSEALEQTAPLRALLTRQWLHPDGKNASDAGKLLTL